MLLDYTVSKKDYMDAIYGELSRLNKGTKSGNLLQGIAVFYAIAITATIASVKAAGLDDLTIIMPSVAAFLFFVASSVLTNRRLKARLSLNKMAKSGALGGVFFGRHAVEATEDRLIINLDGITIDRFYFTINHIAEYNGLTALYSGAAFCALIPDRAFASPDERIRFMSILADKTAAGGRGGREGRGARARGSHRRYIGRAARNIYN